MKQMICFIVSLLVLFSLNVWSQSESPHVPGTKVLRRTFLIQTDTLGGTCFTIIYQQREFVITARHLFKKNLKSGGKTEITLLIGRELKSITATFHKSRNDSLDIAVLTLPLLTHNVDSYHYEGTPLFGQDVYFIGYPSFNGTLFLTDDKKESYFPIIKKAILSGSVRISNDVSYFLLDGHNNPGFSGGPVIFYNYETKQNELLGIISGYYLQENALKDKSLNSKQIMENSGIIQGYYINDAINIIKDIKN